jgi:hypothetical protein
MNDAITTVVAIVAIFLGLPLALLLARDWFSRPSKKKIEAYAQEFTHRLQNPDFAAVEKHFGRPLPDCVQALYADTAELMRKDFEVSASADVSQEERWHVAFYQPADGQSARDTWPGLEKYFMFADDGCGNGYLIDPKENDPPVLFHDHEGGGISFVCDRFTKFMRWPRLP